MEKAHQVLKNPVLEMIDINSAHITSARVSHVDTEECEGGQEMQPRLGF